MSKPFRYFNSSPEVIRLVVMMYARSASRHRQSPDFLLSYGGNGANAVYVEENPAKGFNSATDMILSIQASTSTALTYKDIIT
jgi:hypothetical protein